MSSPIISLEIQQRVALLEFETGQPLNALNQAFISQFANALEELAANEKVSVLVIYGSNDVFAAGVDVTEMVGQTYPETSNTDFLAKGWNALGDFPKPVVAAVNGYALGGGCELAMMADIVLSTPEAIFGQPEINLGIIPGMGGTQRLPRLMGKGQAMRLCLTGQKIKAHEAMEVGIVTEVVAADQLVPAALSLGREIAQKPLPALLQAKKAILAADESPLTVGLKKERELFYHLFATQDQKEGMRAFLEKRPPNFQHK